MKRFLTILLTTLALTAALCVNASASNFDDVADELAAIGMLKGSASGYNLDQAPTRSQAAIMLVRLFGAEDRAQKTYASGRITCPFTDATETTAPYLAWLADEGLASGTTATTFGGSTPCTARAYTIFLLRALGYEDNTDFTTGTAQDFAASLGIQDTSALTGNFLRDDLVAMTYQALATDMKDSNTCLLDNLIKNEAINPNTAGIIVEKIANYRAINAASVSLNTGLDTKIKMDMGVTVSGTGKGQVANQVDQTKVSGEGTIKMILNKNPQMACDLTMNADGESQNMKMWLQGGWLYMQTGEEAVKMEMPDEYMDILISAASKKSDASILPFIESVTKKTSGSDEIYTVTMNSTLGTMMNSIISQVYKAAGIPEDIISSLKISGFTMTYTVRAGTLKSASADAAMTLDMDLNMGQGTAPLKATVGMVMNVGMDINASGSAVKITYPNFSSFKEIIGGADGPTSIIGTQIPA